MGTFLKVVGGVVVGLAVVGTVTSMIAAAKLKHLLRDLERQATAAADQVVADLKAA